MRTPCLANPALLSAVCVLTASRPASLFCACFLQSAMSAQSRLSTTRCPGLAAVLAWCLARPVLLGVRLRSLVLLWRPAPPPEFSQSTAHAPRMPSQVSDGCDVPCMPDCAGLLCSADLLTVCRQLLREEQIRADHSTPQHSSTCASMHAGRLLLLCPAAHQSVCTARCLFPAACTNASLPTPPNAQPWPSSCSPGNADAVCTAQCKPGFIGTVSTVCLPTGIWNPNVTGGCVQGELRKQHSAASMSSSHAQSSRRLSNSSTSPAQTRLQAAQHARCINTLQDSMLAATACHAMQVAGAMD
jgi:hypothetical protein